MTKGGNSHLEMAPVCQNDGINVIFDQNSPALSCAHSRSRSRSSGGSRHSVGSGRHRGRDSHRGRYRSSSSSSSSKSSSHSRSRSHPRCHRPSSRCRCDNHRRYGCGLKSQRQRQGAHSRSPSPYKHSHNQRNRSRSSRHLNRHRRAVSRVSQSPPRTHSSRSRSRSSGHSVNLSLNDKANLLEAPKASATMILGGEELELSESVKPILSESRQVSPDTWVRLDPEKTPTQSDEVESDDMFSQKMSPKRKIICFSINNSVVKPIVAAPSGAKVTSRVDSYESRKPYGHWVPVKSGQTSKARKHTLAMSH